MNRRRPGWAWFWYYKGLKVAKYKIQKPSTCCATLFRCKFWSMFHDFHLAWSTWFATETFVAGWRNAALWLVDLPEHEQICCAPSCKLDEKRATKPNLLHKVDLRSTFRNNFLQSNVFVARQVDYSRWKTGRNKTMLRAKLRVFVSRLSPQMWLHDKISALLARIPSLPYRDLG